MRGARVGSRANVVSESIGAVHMAATLAANFAAMCRVGLPGGGLLFYTEMQSEISEYLLCDWISALNLTP